MVKKIQREVMANKLQNKNWSLALNLVAVPPI